MTPRRSYEVVVSGHVGRAVADTLAPLTLTAVNGETTISGEGFDARSEERRVGKECRSRWSPYH